MRTIYWSLLAVLATAISCGDPTPSPGKTAGTNVAASKPAAPRTRGPDAKAMFESLCVTCHGSTGHGDGPGAASVNPKPRSFADVAWQDSVTDEHIRKTIVLGGAAVGKSAAMPAQPQLKSQEAILDGLVRIVRGFKNDAKGDTKQ